MTTLIRQLHKKPKSVRRQIALGLSSLITFFIFAIWLSVFPGSVSEKKYTEVSPLNNIKNSLAGSYSALKENFSNLKVVDEAQE